MKRAYLLAFFLWLFGSNAGVVLSQDRTFLVRSTTSSICDISSDDSLYLYVRAANCWINVDARKAIDTVRLYVERHPFATHSPGEVLDAINDGYGFVGSLLPHPIKNDWIEAYNWLLKIMPLNQEAAYQYTVLETIADDLGQFDLNESANMYWNISLWYPDTGSVRMCWNNIRSIRHYQKEIPQDTTPFHILTFPLQPLPGGTSGVHNNQPNSVTFTIAPNPASESTSAEISTTNTGFFTIQLFDMLGKKIKDIYSGDIDAGNRKITVDLHDVSQGEYFLRMGSPIGVKTVKIIHE